MGHTFARRHLVNTVGGVSLHRIPKAGSLSLRKAVTDYLAIPVRPGETKPRLEHPDLLITAPDDPRLCFKVAFLRDPVDRLISCWRDKIAQLGPRHHGQLMTKPEGTGRYFGMPFDEFVETVIPVRDENVHTQAQVQFLSDGMDFIGRVETFGRDWERLRERFPWLPPLPHLNAAGSTPPVVSPELRARIEALYAEDYVYLGDL